MVMVAVGVQVIMAVELPLRLVVGVVPVMSIRQVE